MKTEDIVGLDDEAFEAKFIENALKLFEDSKNSFQNIHDTFKEDIAFGLLGKQWDSNIESRRKNDGRNCKVFNKCYPMIKQVVNTSMKNSPAILVHPISNSTKETAQKIAGIVRHIENESNAKDKYSICHQDAVAGGLGIIEVKLEEIDGVLEPRIKRVVDPTTVYPDPRAIEPDFSDMEYLFRILEIPKDEFKERFPGYECLDDNKTSWFTSDMAKILEYWVKNSDGSISWFLLNGTDILDSSENYEEKYIGKYIPFAFEIGEDVILDQERHFKSIIRDIRDYQKTLNYMQSEAIDYVEKSAKSPYIVSDASVEPYMEQWNNINTSNDPTLFYVEGKSVPQRVDPPKSPIGYLDAVQRLDQDIRTTVGIRDPLQDIPVSQSGKAIQLQIAQGNVGTYVWVDHLNRMIKHVGRILVDLIPKVYNYPHTQQILGLDGNIDTVRIGEPIVNQFGEMEQFDLSGKYSVNISTGASYEDQKTQTQDQLLELFKLNPSLMQIGGDIFVRNMDFVESNELADRIAATIDPNIIQSSKQTSDVMLKMQMTQMQQEFQKVNAMLEQMTQVLNEKNIEVQTLNEKLNSKQSTEMLKIQADLQKNSADNEAMLLKTSLENSNKIEQENIKANSEEKIKMLEMEIEKLKIMFQKPEVTKNIHTETHTSNTTITPPTMF